MSYGPDPCWKQEQLRSGCLVPCPVTISKDGDPNLFQCRTTLAGGGGEKKKILNNCSELSLLHLMPAASCPITVNLCEGFGSVCFILSNTTYLKTTMRFPLVPLFLRMNKFSSLSFSLHTLELTKLIDLEFRRFAPKVLLCRSSPLWSILPISRT